MGKKSKSSLPAAFPQQTESAYKPVAVGFTGEFLRTSTQALEQVQGWLEIQIDKDRLADPEWLRDPENRKVAMIVLKLASIQANIALGVISGVIRAGERLPDPEKERRRQEALARLHVMMQVPSDPVGDAGKRGKRR